MIKEIIWNSNNTISVNQTLKPKKITGTKLASILGKNPYSTPFQTWCDITHTYDFPFEDTIYTTAGKTIEPKQAQYVKENYFPALVTPTEKFGENYFNSTFGNFFNDEIFGGMWDYLNEENGKVTAVFEMKTTGKGKRKNWNKEVPEYYSLQAALYAYLLNVDDVHMVASFLDKDDYYFPDSYIPTEANTIIINFKLSEKYPNFKEDYLDPALEWYNKYVLSGNSPEFTDDDKELIEALRAQTEILSDKKKEDEMGTFLNDIDMNVVQTLLEDTKNNVDTFESVSMSTVNFYSDSLDAVMQNLYKDVIINPNAPDEMLEKYFLELTSTLYFCGEKLEHLGVYDDMSKSAMKEVYNKAYLDNQQKTVEGKNKTTVAENQAVAEAASVYESAVNSIYSRAYKIFKYKIDAGYEMVKTLSKIISRRMQETQLASPDRNSEMIGNRQILNESYYN